MPNPTLPNLTAFYFVCHIFFYVHFQFLTFELVRDGIFLEIPAAQESVFSALVVSESQPASQPAIPPPRVLTDDVMYCASLPEFPIGKGQGRACNANAICVYAARVCLA